MPNVRLDSAPRTRATNAGDDERGDHRDPRIETELQTLVAGLRHTVADDEPGHAVGEQLGQRHHPAVGGEEDDRRGDQAEDERTGHHELDEELRAERRQDDEEREDDEQCDVPATAAAGELHSGLPNSP